MIGIDWCYKRTTTWTGSRDIKPEMIIKSVV